MSSQIDQGARGHGGDVAECDAEHVRGWTQADAALDQMDPRYFPIATMSRASSSGRRRSRFS